MELRVLNQEGTLLAAVVEEQVELMEVLEVPVEEEMVEIHPHYQEFLEQQILVVVEEDLLPQVLLETIILVVLVDPVS